MLKGQQALHCTGGRLLGNPHKPPVAMPTAWFSTKDPAPPGSTILYGEEMVQPTSVPTRPRGFKAHPQHEEEG